MLLSVVVYNHKLSLGQWFGAGVVFAGISVEAWVKRRGEFVMLAFCGEISVLIYCRRTCKAGDTREREG